MPSVPSTIPINDNLACGVDRNDGTNGKGGTPSLPGQIIVNASNGATNIANIPIEELDDSPVLERAEQFTSRHTRRLSYSEMLNRLGYYSRGALTIDSEGLQYLILSATGQYQKPGRGLLTTVEQCRSIDVPPDKISFRPVKLGLDIMKHPRYFYSLMPTNQIPKFVGISDTNDQINAKQAIIRSIQAYRENPFIPTSSNINNMVGSLHDVIMANLGSGKFTISKVNPNFNPAFKQTDPIDVGTSAGSPPAAASTNGDPNPAIYFFYVNATSSDPNGKIAMALAAAKELIGKLWRMEDAPPISGVEMCWTTYSYVQESLNLGGYIEDPASASPPLPDYFYSSVYPPNPAFTIFDQLSYLNPQCYSANGKYGGGTSISWLRDADENDYQMPLFIKTRKWLGAPFGAWDADLNSQNDRPSVPSDYRNLILG